MPTATFLIGVPASGKSTWVAENVDCDTWLLSTDDFIQSVADANGKTYNDVFADSIMEAVAWLNEDLLSAVEVDADFVIDQTNLTRASRKRKMRLIPKHYEKIAIVFPTPEGAEWKRRLDSRPGKTIPQAVLDSMSLSYQAPTEAEGFDKIVYK